MTIATKLKIKDLAHEILSSFDISSVPVDPLKIAKEENIHTASSSKYGDKFYGRIECHKIKNKKHFILYHPEIDSHAFPQQVRFSIGHELGHFYIPEHRALLFNNKFHSSLTNNWLNPLEIEANYFSSYLLLPDFFLNNYLSGKALIDLDRIIEISQICSTSITATAMRYIEITQEKMAILISDGKKWDFIRLSEDLPYGLNIDFQNKSIPSQSITNSLLREKIFRKEGQIAAEVWFPDSTCNCQVHEEVMALGKGGKALTILTFD